MRRWALAAVFLVAACGGGGSGTPDAGPDATPPDAPDLAPVEYVDPTIGSGGFGYRAGSAFPGAASPAGLVKLGPDTKGEFGTISFLHYSGYWYGDDTIQGFSHLHLHGTGATDYGVLGLMPSDAMGTTRAEYGSKFDKATEVARPGYYAVTLDRGGVRAELTALGGAGVHRYTFTPGAPGWVILDLDHHLEDGSVSDANLTVDAATGRVTGRLHSIGGMSGGFGGYDVWFAAEVRTPWDGDVEWAHGAALRYDAPSAPIEIAVGVSLVDAAGADASLAGAGAFDDVRAASEAAWADRVGRVRVTGGTTAERRMLYSALYRAFLMPTTTSDLDGRYRGPDGQVHTAAGFAYQSDMSLWDTYRTLHPLYDLLAPEAARDAVSSLHAFATEAGYFPKWPIATGESGTMLGSSAEVVLADAYVKGVTDFDAEGAYQILRAAALDPTPPAGGRGGRGDVEDYMTYGYVPASDGRAVSTTTEYGADDYALSQLAAALGHDADATLLLDRSHSYRALYDPAVGFLRNRLADGTFENTLFDPTEFSDGYAEADAWQTTFAASWDVPGSIALLGGQDMFVARLGDLFAMGRAEWEASDPTSFDFASVPRPYYWHGNEPDIHAVYLFAQAGRPDLTQEWLPWIRATQYSDRPEGLAGNDDGGTLSAWYVFSALGLYPIPGSDRYIVGAPIFARAEVAPLGLVIEAENVSPDDVYVQSVTLDGVPLDVPEVRHADLAGATLHFVMGPAASSWGRGP